MSIFELLLLIITVLLLIISAVYSVMAAIAIAKLDGYESNPNLDKSHKWLTWSSVISWIGITIIVLLIIFYIYQNSKGEGETFSSNLAVRIFLFLTLVILITAGVLSANAAIDMENSSRVLEANNSGAYKDAVISTVLALAGGGLILIAFIASLFNSGTSTSSSDKAKETATGKAKESAKKENKSSLTDIPKSLASKENIANLSKLIEEDPELLALA